MFSTLYDTYFSLSMHFKMSSAISLNLDQSKNFSSGNGLRIYIYYNMGGGWHIIFKNYNASGVLIDGGI